jgi:hypothetical protein
MFEISDVIAMLARDFGLGNADSKCRETKKMWFAVKSLLNNATDWDEFEVEEEDELIADERMDSEEENEYDDDDDIDPENTVHFGEA